MKVIDVQQGTSEWLEWRSQGITATDISSIMGVNPYKSRYQLFLEKKNKKKTILNANMIHGQNLEPEARKWLENSLSMDLLPLCVQHPSLSFARASLDGINIDQKYLAEIKCPASDYILDGVKQSGKFPDIYLYQVQWQMLITGFSQADLVFYDYRSQEGTIVHLKEDRDLQLLMLDEAQDFLKLLTQDTAPPLEDTDYLYLDDPELLKLIEKYDSISREKRKLDKEQKELKSLILEFGDGGSFEAAGYRATRHSFPMSYDLDKMKDDGIDLKLYQKIKEGFYFKITKIKENK